MCELSNWNGRVYKISRSDLNEFSLRKDSSNTGIYFLFGKDDEQTIYIGEAENIIKRLKQHLSDKDYWNDCIVVISKDNLLNKAHVKYLEYNFYRLACDSGRMRIINSTIPTCSSVSEFDEAMLIEFIENSKLLINTLGYKVFDSINSDNSRDLIYTIKAVRGADAIGMVVPDGFVVFKDSLISNDTVKSISPSLKNLRDKLINEDIIKDYVFIKDYIFTSPSLASSVVLGRNSNGRTEWKTSQGKTLKDVEEEI